MQRFESGVAWWRRECRFLATTTALPARAKQSKKSWQSFIKIWKTYAVEEARTLYILSRVKQRMIFQPYSCTLIHRQVFLGVWVVSVVDCGLNLLFDLMFWWGLSIWIFKNFFWLFYDLRLINFFIFITVKVLFCCYFSPSLNYLGIIVLVFFSIDRELELALRLLRLFFLCFLSSSPLLLFFKKLLSAKSCFSLLFSTGFWYSLLPGLLFLLLKELGKTLAVWVDHAVLCLLEWFVNTHRNQLLCGLLLDCFV